MVLISSSWLQNKYYNKLKEIEFSRNNEKNELFSFYFIYKYVQFLNWILFKINGMTF